MPGPETGAEMAGENRSTYDNLYDNREISSKFEWINDSEERLAAVEYRRLAYNVITEIKANPESEDIENLLSEMFDSHDKLVVATQNAARRHNTAKYPYYAYGLEAAGKILTEVAKALESRKK